MLPFLKNKLEGSATQSEDDPIERKHDDDFDMLGAVASDLLMGIRKNDKELIKEALEALCDYVMNKDEEQDQTMMGEKA